MPNAATPIFAPTERLILLALQVAPHSTAADIQRLTQTNSARQVAISLRTLKFGGFIEVSQYGAHPRDNKYTLPAER